MTSQSYGGGVQGFCDNSTKASVMKKVQRKGEGSKNVQNCGTSFMEDPFMSAPHLKTGCGNSIFSHPVNRFSGFTFPLQIYLSDQTESNNV